MGLDDSEQAPLDETAGAGAEAEVLDDDKRAPPGGSVGAGAATTGVARCRRARTTRRVGRGRDGGERMSLDDGEL